METLIKLKTVTGYSAHSRALSGWSVEPVGEIPRVIGSPYTFSNSHPVYKDADGKLVVSIEVGHRKYEIHAVADGVKLLPLGTL